MGVRSDVAIAMKEIVHGHLTKEIKDFLEAWGFEEQARIDESDLKKNEDIGFQRTSEEDLGTLFTTQDVKWYHHDYADIIAFYKYMEENHDEDWLILQACHDYPDSEEGDTGGWHDNPFGLRKEISVVLNWE